MSTGHAAKRHHPPSPGDDGDVGPPGADERHDGLPDVDSRDVGPSARPPGMVTAQLATGQQGVVNRAQLLAKGVSRHAIARRAANGDLHRVHRGVYLVGHEALAPLAAERAVLLACGEHAVVSHASAAFVWSMIERPPECIEVTLVGRRRRPKPGIRLHHVVEIDPRDRALFRGVPITAPARTLIDLASGASDEALARAVAEARVRGLLRKGAIEQALVASIARSLTAPA